MWSYFNRFMLLFINNIRGKGRWYEVMYTKLSVWSCHSQFYGSTIYLTDSYNGHYARAEMPSAAPGKE